MDKYMIYINDPFDIKDIQIQFSYNELKTLIDILTLNQFNQYKYILNRLIDKKIQYQLKYSE